MKTLPIALLLSLVFFNCYSQRYAITPVSSPIVYVGIDNPLNILVEGYPCESVFISTNNGKVKSDSCHYSINPAAQGYNTTVFIQVDSAGIIKTIGQTVLVAMDIPMPGFRISMYGNGSIAWKKQIAAQLYVRVEYENNSECYLLHGQHIDSFTMTVIRDQKTISVTKNDSNKLNEDAKFALNTLQTGDVLLFSDIWCTLADGKKYQAYDARMTIRE